MKGKRRKKEKKTEKKTPSRKFGKKRIIENLELKKLET